MSKFKVPDRSYSFYGRLYKTAKALGGQAECLTNSSLKDYDDYENVITGSGYDNHDYHMICHPNTMNDIAIENNENVIMIVDLRTKFFMPRSIKFKKGLNNV